MGTLLFVSSGIPAITLCSIVVLFISNSFVKKRTRFHLNTSYQLHGNKSVLSSLLSLDVLQATISGLGTSSTFIIMTFKDQLASTTELCWLRHIYSLTTLLRHQLLYGLQSGGRDDWKLTEWMLMKKRSKTDNDIYFRTYGEMWGYRGESRKTCSKQ
nr:unnamed protein product [Haemonchus contortus]